MAATSSSREPSRSPRQPEISCENEMGTASCRWVRAALDHALVLSPPDGTSVATSWSIAGSRRPVTASAAATCMAVGEGVVGGLAHVDRVVGMDRPLERHVALGRELVGAVGQHLVHVHVGLRAGARLPHHEREVGVMPSGEHLVRRGADEVARLGAQGDPGARWPVPRPSSPAQRRPRSPGGMRSGAKWESSRGCARSARPRGRPTARASPPSSRARTRQPSRTSLSLTPGPPRCRKPRGRGRGGRTSRAAPCPT